MAAALAALAGAAPAARAALAATGPGAFVTGYVTPVVVMPQGDGVTYHNADIAPHNFVADGVYLSKKAARRAKWCTAFEGRCPLFWSPTITAGESTDVVGLDPLKPGEYPFFCSVHPNMKGTLVVQ